jgi:hypothetical protein
VAEHFVLPESVYAPPVVVSEVGGGSRCHNCNIDLQVEARVILGDLNESIPVTGRYGQFLEVVCVPVDVTGALEVRVGLKLGEGLVLLVLLYEPEVELSLKFGLSGEWEQDGR